MNHLGRVLYIFKEKFKNYLHGGREQTFAGNRVRPSETVFWAAVTSDILGCGCRSAY